MLGASPATWSLNDEREVSITELRIARELLANMRVFTTSYLPETNSQNIRTCTEPSAGRSRKRPNIRERCLGFALWDTPRGRLSNAEQSHWLAIRIAKLDDVSMLLTLPLREFR